jgi:hypothetical protein
VDAKRSGRREEGGGEEQRPQFWSASQAAATVSSKYYGAASAVTDKRSNKCYGVASAVIDERSNKKQPEAGSSTVRRRLSWDALVRRASRPPPRSASPPLHRQMFISGVSCPPVASMWLLHSSLRQDFTACGTIVFGLGKLPPFQFLPASFGHFMWGSASARRQMVGWPVAACICALPLFSCGRRRCCDSGSCQAWSCSCLFDGLGLV